MYRILLAALIFPTAADPPAGKHKLIVVLISGSAEYKSDESLAAFQKHLEANYPIECKRAFSTSETNIPGLDALESCDVALFFTRRLLPPKEQLEQIKKYVQVGKPIVAIRTASHGFQNWLEMDKEILGGNYQGHYKEGPMCEVKTTKSGLTHPILEGVKPFTSPGSLYKNPDLTSKVDVLLTGSIPDQSEPVAWVGPNKERRIFYTSLGHPKDFADPNYVRMLTNAIYWTANRKPEALKP